MACAGETFEQEFATLLSMVTSYSIAEREDGEGLLLGLGIPEGSMTFSAGEINIPVYNPNEVEPTIDLDDFVGMTESAAITYAAENDVEFRIGSVDGEAQAVTADYRIGRVTADIVDGVVTGFSVE
jgi:beta-lactam-binding protein with PASTA domain